MTETQTLLALQQFADSAFPSGMFTHSLGLEQLARDGVLKSAASVEKFVRAALEGSVATSDAVAAVSAARLANAGDMDGITAVDGDLFSMKPASELRRASTDAGRRLLEEVAAHTDLDMVNALLAEVRSGRTPGTHAVAFGVVTSSFGGHPETAAATLLQSTANAILQAAMRLLPVSHRDVQGALHRLRPRIAILAALASRAGRAAAVLSPFAGHRLDAPRAVPGAHVRELTMAFQVGVGGPVGSGKTALVEQLVPLLILRGRHPAIVANDIFTTEDACILRRALDGVLPEDLIVGVETGGCPHTAVREDPTANLSAIAALLAGYPETDVVLVESGGDNLTLTFSPLLAHTSIYVLDVASGDKTPRKQGPGMMNADLLVINKVDLAPHVGADLDVMERDASALRRGPLVFTNCRTGEGVMQVADWLESQIIQHLAASAHAS